MNENQIKAIQKWMEECTQILCYQPDIPLAHKTDLANALFQVNRALGIEKLPPEPVKP
jgi:hypothetical protein